ncbi:MAG TPA: hypothetical protein VF128_08395 [Gemmatimonadaceae bacterium]
MTLPFVSLKNELCMVFRDRLLALVLITVACGGSNDGPLEPPSGPTRTFRMGFSAIPPRANEAVLLAALDMWTQRGDAAIMHVSPPWAALLSGVSATAAVNANELPLANYYRAKNLEVVVMVDATDGLNRAAEAPELVQLGRSISELSVQLAYRQFVMALSLIVKPTWLGLAAETNLIRKVAPSPLYSSLVQMVNAAENDLRGIASATKRYVSVQVDVAWGRPLDNGAYQGVERDFADFPFMQALGLSSYPYFVFADPDEVPLDYYSRLPNGRPLSVMVVEGGWTSGTAGSIVSSPDKQARYIRRQARMLDSARATALFQLTFTDLDVASLNLPPGSILPLFAQLGLVDTELRPKPVLAVWDSLFAVRRSP